MTPIEKIYNEESTNMGVMILRPEGMFYRAYEHSAFLVCKTVKEFKPTKRFFKKIGKEVVSIGFPQDTYGKYIGERGAVFDADGTIRVQSGAEIDDVLFRSWKDSLPLAGPRENDSLVNGDRIQAYRESYALLIQVFEAVVNIQKDYKSIPGEDIRRDCLELVRCVLQANDAKEDAVRASFIKKALACDEDIKLLLRILCDLKQISPGAYMMLSGMVVSISGQLKAWLSYTEKHSNQKVTGTPHTQGQGSE